VGLFLKHLPDAARSPLAFVAYCILVGAWVLRYWLAANPHREARKILAQFHDDQTRLQALGRIFNDTPPAGLRGNEAILTWVKTKSSDRVRMLLVIAWLATVVAIGIFLVALRNATTNERHITIRLHHIGTSGDCPSMPSGAHLIIQDTNHGQLADVRIAEGCNASAVLTGVAKDLATLALLNSEPYVLAEPKATYQLAEEHWNVYVTDLGLRISLFQYSGECENLSDTYATFESILSRKARSLRGMFPGDSRYDYLAALSVIPTGQPMQMGTEAVERYLQQTRSLQALAGSCFHRNGNNFMLSEIFLGHLHGFLSEPFVADLPVTPEEFQETTDLHTVSMLYALAQDARDHQLGQDIVISFLAHAREIAEQLNVGSSSNLLQAIDQSLQEVGAPERMKL